MPTDRLKVALEAVAVGLWDWNVRTGDLWWSDNLPAIHGIPEDGFDGTFERFLSFIHPEDRASFAEVLERAVRSTDDFSAEFRVVGAGNAIRWIRGQGRVYRDEFGQAYRVIGIGYDISSKRAEQSASRQLGVIALASSDAIVTIDGAGTVTAWNPGAEHLFGYTADEMIGQPIRRIAPEGRAGEIEQILRRLSLGHRVDNYETERVRKDGSHIFVSISSGPLIDDSGTWTGAVTITRDITLRRREEDRQRLLADASNVLSSSLETDTTLLELASVLVPRFADRCAIHLCQEDGSLIAVSDTEDAGAGPTTSAGDSPARVLPSHLTKQRLRVVETGEPLLSDLDSEGESEGEPASKYSAIVVPMMARGATLGTLSLVSGRARRRFDREDLSLTIEIARRAALAVDNAMLFNRVRSAERQLRLVSDNLPALVSYVSADYRYLFANRRYDDYVGVPSESLIGRPLREVLTPADFEQVAPKLAAAMRGESVRYDVDVTYAKAGERHVEVEYVPDIGPGGDVRGAVALIVDITERARQQRLASRLYELTAALAGAVTEDDVASCIVTLGTDALGGRAGAVAVLSEDGSGLVLRAVRGYPPDYAANYPRIVSDDSAIGVAIHSGNPVLLSTPEERLARFPLQATLGADLKEGAFAALPLEVDGRTLGALVVVFPAPTQFEQTEIDFMMTLANLCAQSLDRARLYDSERRTRSVVETDRARVAFLAEASRILAGSLDVGVDLKRVMAIAAGALCDWCTIHLYEEDGTIHRLGVVHRDPEMSPVAQELERAYSVLPATCWRSVRDALSEGRSWFDAAVSEERLLSETMDEGHRELLKRLGFASEMVVPMIAGGRMVGSVTFARGPQTDPFVRDDLSLAEELGRRIALALDNVRLFAGAQASESRYRTVFEEASEAILIVDPQAVVRSGNEAAARLVGVDREELNDRPIDSIVTGPRLEPGAADEWNYLQPGWQGELEAVCADGSTIPVEMHTTLVELPSGAAYLVSLRDISERRALERLQRDFLAMVTHDLRSPLSAIRMHSQLMRRREQYSPSSLDSIIGQTDRMASLINSLADVVRTDSGRLELNRDELDLVELVKRVADQEYALDPGRSIEVRAASSVVGSWDADRLSQVVSNLIGNAVKYSPAGSKVVVDVSQADGEAIVAVTDYGSGIAAEHQPKLFERFYRADVTGAGGLGLGLYIARMLTEAHGGRIGVESRAGHGSTFTVRLPLGAE